MINYPTSNFATVFFLVVIFIGMGLLIYHAAELTLEYNQLQDVVETLQANISSLKSENENLKSEMTPLKTQNTELADVNASLVDENSQLRALYEQTVAENITLKEMDTDNLSELEKLRTENSGLRLENLRLRMLQSSSVEHRTEEPVVLQSAILPADLYSWMSVVAVILVAVIIVISCTLYILLKDIRQKKNAPVYGKDLKDKATKRTGKSIDSHFTNR